MGPGEYDGPRPWNPQRHAIDAGREVFILVGLRAGYTARSVSYTEIENRIAAMENATSILVYWFGTSADDADVVREKSSLWWKKDPETDAEIRRRFEQTVEAETRGALESWSGSPRGQLARTLLCDQFPRNMYRDTPRAFAGDGRARQIARALLDLGTDRKLRRIERVFVYLPFEHSENAQDQATSVRLFSALRDEASNVEKATYENYLGYALKHQAIIDRFGRFPHRNRILGRESSPEERGFLKGPDSSF
jgi:uncharacterized protein (DUF924 family)